MNGLYSHNQRCFAIYLNIDGRLFSRLYNERCSTQFKFRSKTITDEEFGQIIEDLNNKVCFCRHWISEGIFLYFDR